MGRASALVFAREDALVVGCDLSVGAAQATSTGSRTSATRSGIAPPATRPTSSGGMKVW